MTGGQAVEERVAGLFSLKGEETTKRSLVHAGDTVALGRLDSVRHGRHHHVRESGRGAGRRAEAARAGVGLAASASRTARTR